MRNGSALRHMKSECIINTWLLNSEFKTNMVLTKETLCFCWTVNKVALMNPNSTEICKTSL